MDDFIYRGIIIRQNNYGDAHRMLSVFTKDSGIIKAIRYGVRGKKTSNAAAFQLFCYGDFKLRPSRGEIMTAVSADIIDGFYPVSEDIVKLALLTYLADITFCLLGEGNPDNRILSIFLNTVYAAAYMNEDYLKLKTVYELKLMCAGGYMPNFSRCSACGGAPEYFKPDSGSFVCRLHHSAGDIKVSSGAAALMKYIAEVPDKRMLAFKLKDESVLEELNAITEKYVSIQCERTFESLRYFRAMLDA